MKNYSLKIIGVVALLLSQSVFAQHEILKEEIVKKIDSLFNSYHHNDETGSIMSILKNNETAYTTQKGLANVEYQLPITDTSSFNIASNSKQFTTFLALMLEEDGKLSFDDDIRVDTLD
jgi:CubicO group peptidase (beta-lactamase class C family)